jgi:hypothetical protein
MGLSLGMKLENWPPKSAPVVAPPAGAVAVSGPASATPVPGTVAPVSSVQSVPKA